MSDSMQKALDASVPPLNTFHDEVVKSFSDLEDQSADVRQKMLDTVGKALDSLSDQLARLAVTGKHSFRQMATGLAEQTMKTGIHAGFGGIGGKVADAFGFKPPGAHGARGDSPQNALYVQEVSAKRGMIPGVSGGKTVSEGGGGGGGTGGDGQGGIADSITGGMKSMSSKLEGSMDSVFKDLSGVFSKLTGSMGSVLGSLTKLFGGFLAGGGAVSPGKAYVVGEHHPEFFVPRQAGQVAPSLSLGANRQTVLNFSVNGVQDADSFRHSQGQIMAMMENQTAHAHREKPVTAGQPRHPAMLER
jgi:phage-related minor tail protein